VCGDINFVNIRLVVIDLFFNSLPNTSVLLTGFIVLMQPYGALFALSGGHAFISACCL